MPTDDLTQCPTVNVTMTKSSSCMSSTSNSSRGTTQTSDEAVPSIKTKHTDVREVHRVKFAEEKNEYCNLSDSRPLSAANCDNNQGADHENDLTESATLSSCSRPPIIKTPRPRSPEDHDNPFALDGELRRKADYIILYSKFSRTEIRIADPDLLPSFRHHEMAATAPPLCSTNLVYTSDSTASPSLDFTTETVGFVVAGVIAPEKALPVMVVDSDFDEPRPTSSVAEKNGTAMVMLKTGLYNIGAASSPSTSTSSSRGQIAIAPPGSPGGVSVLDGPGDKRRSKGSAKMRPADGEKRSCCVLQ